ncbi:hypothetical protein CFP71_14935 [Amycolatopsis thailandensis]|uniref:Capsular polysaccharide biosynthesis protein n=1 Tax=Amycolatopsis thailandensis TaxID=589330 RepID=A0A229SC46_9PSEU|nr:hypothetical protein CFP71_14935 [Amycolatopsis thailandensis]
MLAGSLVLLLGLSRGEQFQGRVSLLAEPVGQTEGSPANYGEVVTLTLPALVELARSPSVLLAAAPISGFAPEELRERVTVELVPASGLARLSVRAPSADRARTTASALGQAMIDANLLGTAGRLRTLDPRPDVVTTAPDTPLVSGLALIAAVAAGLATIAIRRLRPSGPRHGAGAVRRALASAGIHRTVTVLRSEDPSVADRLAVLGLAAGEPPRVLPAGPEFTEPAAKLAATLPSDAPAGGSSVVIVAGRHRYDELVATASVLPPDAVLLAVVLA